MTFLKLKSNEHDRNDIGCKAKSINWNFKHMCSGRVLRCSLVSRLRNVTNSCASDRESLINNLIHHSQRVWRRKRTQKTRLLNLERANALKLVRGKTPARDTRQDEHCNENTSSYARHNSALWVDTQGTQWGVRRCE